MRGSHTGVHGQGHVVAHNRVSRFSDSLAIFNDGQTPADIRKQAINIDFTHNDLSYAIDDTVETDYGCHNIRVIRNLVYNTHTGRGKTSDRDAFPHVTLVKSAGGIGPYRGLLYVPRRHTGSKSHRPAGVTCE